MGLFSPKKKKEAAPTTQESIEKLRDLEDQLIKKQTYLERKIQEEVATAVKHGTANKREALRALNRKRAHEKTLEQTFGTLQTIEFQRQSLENASSNVEVLKVMGAASKSLKNALGNMNEEDVHNMMEDIAEQKELADEIGNAISSPANFAAAYDEDELLQELEALELEDLDQKYHVHDPTPLPSLPDVPIRPMAGSSKRQEQKDDLDALADWASDSQIMKM
ncbi:hypothetical protein PRIPAC_76999 [Pristionchus pacificus]|nr:hypothetical protein PRIPAC_76999 [Pristionchus pacificus]